MDDSRDSGSLNARLLDWRERYIALMERLIDALEKGSIWIKSVKEKPGEQLAELTGSSKTPAEKIEALSRRIGSLEDTIEAVREDQALAREAQSEMRERSDILGNARRDKTLTADLLDKGDEVLSSAERTIVALEQRFGSQPEL
jgi:hypothetical protein